MSIFLTELEEIILYYHIIACQVFQRELSYLISKSNNILSVSWLPQGLHETPVLLNKRLIDAMNDVMKDVNEGRLKHKPDAFLLCYGLCSNGTVGLKADDIPIVIPKTDDCIALFLGSQKRYLDLFNRKNGTYWLNNGWMETSFVATKEEKERRKNEYIDKYGEENADYLMEQELLFMKNYKSCGYISSPVFNGNDYSHIAQKLSSEWELDFFQEEGSLSLIEKLINGQWNDKEFLVCPCGYKTEASFGEDKLCAVKDL